MNNEKSLEMSVTIPPPKSAVSRQFYHLIIGALFLIFVFSLIVAGGFYKRESLKNDRLVRDNRWLQEDNDRIYNERRELTNDMFEAYHITNEKSRNDVWECIDHPKDLLVSPWELGLERLELTCPPAHGKCESEAMFHKSMYGHYWQMPGDSLDNGVFFYEGYITITRAGDYYSLVPITLPAVVNNPDCSSPTTSLLVFQDLVPVSNTGIWHTVFRRCLANIMDRDIGFTRHMVTAYSN